MKTYGEVCDEYAQEFGYKNYYGIPKDARLYHAERIAKRYATEAIKEHLSRAAENAEVDYRGQETQFPIEVIDSSITSIEIILP